MRLVAITTFPPSSYAHSSFGYFAISRFLEIPEIEEIIVLADVISIPDTPPQDPRIHIERIWAYNSPFTLIKVMRSVLKYHPDAVWLSYHYTLFASKPLLMVPGFLIPTCLEKLGYPVILLLHNFLAVVDLGEMGIRIPCQLQPLIRRLDKIVMACLLQSRKVFTMVEKHARYLRDHYPSANVEYVEQDLYKPLAFHPVCQSHDVILTMGYFGTHKRLETLLDAFELLRKSLPTAELRIAGSSNQLSPHYLQEVQSERSRRFKNVEFLGYISEDELPNLFWDSNLVVITTRTHAGSSAVLRYASTFGRAVVAPNSGFFENIDKDGWGVVLYEQYDAESLASALLQILIDKVKQTSLASANHQKSLSSHDDFLRAHTEAFQSLLHHRAFPPERRIKRNAFPDVHFFQ